MAELATGTTKTRKVIKSPTFLPFAIDIILSFIRKEKEKLNDFKTLLSYQKYYFSDMGGGMEFKSADKKQKVKKLLESQ